MDTNAHLERLESSHYRTGMEALEDRYNECVTLEGDCPEE